MTATVAGIHLGLDTHANRPAANTVPDGSVYSCSTHSLVYKSNLAGNSWATWATLGTSTTTIANDTFWAAAGDLAVATGNDAASILPIGASGKVLKSNGTTAAWGYPSFHGCSVRNNAAITTNNTTDKLLTFNAEQWDTDAYHDTGTNPGRITIPTGLGGYYHIDGGIQWVSNATGWRQLYIYLNGATILKLVQLPTISGDDMRMEISRDYPLAQGDYIELHCAQNSGGDLDVGQGAEFSPIFSVSLLGV